MRFRTLLILLLLAAVPAFYAGAAQTHDSNASGDIAHGSEKDAHEKVHPGEEHGEGHEAPKTYFGIPGWLLKIVNMLLFIGFLYWVAGGPVKSAFAARTAAIKAAAEEAKARRAKADQLATDIQARLSQIEDEVRAIAARALVEGERQKKELIASAEAEAQKILAAARNEVDNRLKFARKELTEYAGQLASERAEQILRDKITDADRHKLFADSLREVGEVQS